MKYLKFTGILALVLLATWLSSLLPSGDLAWAVAPQSAERQTVPLTPVRTFTKTPTGLPPSATSTATPPPTETGTPGPSATETRPPGPSTTSTITPPETPTVAGSRPPATPTDSSRPPPTSTQSATPSPAATQTLAQAASGTPSSQPQATSTSRPAPGATAVASGVPTDIAPGRTPARTIGTPPGFATPNSQQEAAPQPLASLDSNGGVSIVGIGLFVGSIVVGLGLVLGRLKKQG